MSPSVTPPGLVELTLNVPVDVADLVTVLLEAIVVAGVTVVVSVLLAPGAIPLLVGGLAPLSPNWGTDT